VRPAQSLAERESLLNGLVYEAYGLTADEVAITEDTVKTERVKPMESDNL
jgi:hypothetical protein